MAKRMANARAAKADKKRTRIRSEGKEDRSDKIFITNERLVSRERLKDPKNKVVCTGERGGRFYINPNGKRTYLSSNS